MILDVKNNVVSSLYLSVRALMKKANEKMTYSLTAKYLCRVLSPCMNLQMDFQQCYFVKLPPKKMLKSPEKFPTAVTLTCLTLSLTEDTLLFLFSMTTCIQVQKELPF